MKWYKHDCVIYGPKTTKAYCKIKDVKWKFIVVNKVNPPLLVAQIIDQYNLMTDEIRKELEDYIFVDV